MREDLKAETITFEGHLGNEINGYLAEPLDEGRYGAVIVIHHLPGYDASTREIARRFAADGYLTLCPNLYSREGNNISEDDAAASARAKGGISDDQLLGDIEGAMRLLRSHPMSNGKVGTIGYCSGGRQSFLCACSLPIDAAVDCYGAFVVGTPPEGFPMKVTPLTDKVPDLGCPLLGLFGQDDSFPSPEQMVELAGLLEAAGKDYDFHTYEGASHAFFSTNRESFRPDAALDGWEKIFTFFGEYLN